MLQKPFIVYKDFLPEQTNCSLLEYAIGNREKFRNSTIEALAKNPENSIDPSSQNWRKSKHVYQEDFERFYTILKEKIFSMYNSITSQLDLSAFEIGSVEMQMTSHNDGDFYKPHADKSDVSHASRMITFVYYFHSIPKAFSGGQLLFFQPAPSIVEPDNNSIVFFDSSIKHAVHPISCPSKQFEHSRFSLNGWIRK